MSDVTNNGATAPAEAAAGPAFTIEKIYVKDVSFESPNAPAVFNDNVQPELQLNLNQRVQRLNEQAFEVVLAVTLTCTAAGKTAYVAEVQQAGVFGLVGLDPQAVDVLLGTQCPNILFPYVRSLVSDLIQAGGFPPFFLQPINFEALYAETLRQRAQQDESQSLADSEPAGNA
ncbi:protein-export chaperone SecB [Xanthomonas translucens pv. arrhenatheri]|jgi:preprotein translocase subunit SecB|uniref:Protein-export protein SecB n=5 Tax=Xanthomonas translucens group TaxID=3390202 RepID=A0A0K2ZNR4_9XANT|nr:protein-export chaperone SecB [Xanthomonas translucens]EKU23632.1 protein-export protein [Xanthomonas translucens pv. graminis ART-Xtg29]MCC8446216.1 protein-export chaperone SecB [Xanthomonas translucens pv. translucens]MCT8285194.1 protein-export chaperone SecB [Xanthomonas translucens pv. translucens]MCT8302852.1 protein-export chaperone SecB [Xanthomonas translucens pv. translucens]OAX54570.1 protein-export chaperone SecB [Xanthomonas translucens pv. poae]